MERESCFSLNLSTVSPRQGLANPMADSTRIDRAPASALIPKLSRLYTLPGSDLDEGRERSFSQGQRSSSFCTLNIGSPSKSLVDLNRSSSSTTNTRQKLNLSQLDPRTYADVNSTGLASRIAKYHESAEGGRLQRSISVNNLPNPLVRPRRSIASPLPYKPSVPKLSVTQIAPPERSFYSGNTLSSLLRSNSVVGVVHKLGEQQGQEQLSRENRPIMHPPPTQQEIEPTRSVLEELKEISRKRINSGETQMPHEFGKKRMTRTVDSHTQPPPQSGPSSVSFKRQREPAPLTVAVPIRQHHNVPPSPALQHLQSNGVVIPTLSTPQQLSPEQQAAKRRICSYNNDIASSLSSSRRHSHKRKLYDMRVNQSYSRIGNDVSAVNASYGGSSPENTSGEHAAKIQRKTETDTTVCKTLSMTTPTAIPIAVPPPRMNSAPPTEVDGVPQSVSAAMSLPEAPKPKLTLFNTHQKSQSQIDQQEQQEQLELDSPEVDAGEYAGIQFVKPKQQNSMIAKLGKNPAIERMQKTKLAIMLSGLRGEIYVGESEDENDAPKVTTSSKLSTPIKPIIATTTTTTTATPATLAAAVTTTTTTTTTAAAAVATTTKPNVEFQLQTSPTITAQIKPTLKLDNQNPTLTTTTTATATVTAGIIPQTIQTATTTAATGTPFTFGDLVKGATAGNKIATSGSNGTDLVGSDLTIKPSTSDTLTTTTTATVIPTLTFKPPAATTPQTTADKIHNNALAATTNTSNAPAMFEFGGSTANNSNVSALLTFGNAATPTTTTTTAAGTSKDAVVVSSVATNPTTGTSTAFTFGGASGSTPASTSTTTSTFPTPAATTTFGQLNKAITNATTSTTTTITTNGSSTGSGFGGFTFNSNTSAPAPAPAANPALTGFGNQSNSFPNNFKQSEVATTNTATAGAVNTIFGNQTTSNSFANAFKSTEPNPNVTTAPSSSAPSQDAGKAFNFTATATTTTTASASIQPSTTTANVFSFGTNDSSKPTQPASSTTNIFGQNPFEQKPAPATGVSNPFAFGGNKPTVPATTAAPTLFTFGGAKPTAPVVAASNEASTPFTFGGTKSAASTPSAVTEKSTAFTFSGAKPPASNLFSFGAAAAAAAAQAPPTATSVNNVSGTVSSSNNAFNFGGVTGQKSASVFGSQVSSTGTAAPSAAATAKPFTFGTAATSSTVEQQQQQTNLDSSARGFSFGGALNKTNGESNGTPNIFGTSTGAIKNSFNFGDNNANSTSNAAPAAASNFGQFGAAASVTSNQSKPFSFGANTSGSATPAAVPLGGNLFANAVAAAQFGATSTPSNSNASAKPFNFGASQTTSNVFSTSTPAPAPTKPAAAFQFGATASSPAMPTTTQQINANIFAPPENRLIRRATRRLQK